MSLPRSDSVPVSNTPDVHSSWIRLGLGPLIDDEMGWKRLKFISGSSVLPRRTDLRMKIRPEDQGVSEAGGDPSLLLPFGYSGMSK